MLLKGVVQGGSSVSGRGSICRRVACVRADVLRKRVVGLPSCLWRRLSRCDPGSARGEQSCDRYLVYHSARSPWVRDEVSRAARQNKLITVRVAVFDVAQLPLPFGQRQCDPVSGSATSLALSGRNERRWLRGDGFTGPHD